MQRVIELILDEADHDAVQREFAHRQAASRKVDPHGPTILPDGTSNLAGALVAEMARDLEEYRQIYDRDHPAPGCDPE
jgi:hypothetical protein